MTTQQFLAYSSLIALLLATLALAGCANSQRYAAAAEEATKQAKDTEASILEEAPCLIGLGAWSRMTDPRKRDGVFYLCVPDAADYGVELQ